MSALRRLILATVLLAMALPCAAERIKDMVEIQGVRKNQLLGYGLVIGLNGTGDSARITQRVMANVFRRMDLAVNESDVSSANVASVIVTATLPPFAKEGTTLDVTVSTAGDAASLQGGELLITPLRGADGQVYAVAQGAVLVGGFKAAGRASSVTKNHPTVGRIPNGATIEREEPTQFIFNQMIGFNLRHPDFVTSSRVAQAINGVFERTAVAVDAATILVRVPPEAARGGVVDFLAKVSHIEAVPDQRAVVIINERTGTVVAGENVRIARVAISHGSLSVVTQERDAVSQANPFAQGGTTERVAQTSIDATEEGGGMQVVGATATVSDLARALNAMGVTPRDLISIFEALAKAGALQAELQIM